MSLLFLQQNEVFMKKYISILKQTKLFADVNEQEIESMLGCLQAKIFD